MLAFVHAMFDQPPRQDNFGESVRQQWFLGADPTWVVGERRALQSRTVFEVDGKEWDIETEAFCPVPGGIGNRTGPYEHLSHRCLL